MTKTILITGGGRGIGRELTLLLSDKDYNIAICSRSTNEIEKTVNDVINHGHNNIMGIKCDITNTSDINSLLDTISKKFSQIDILINNAGLAIVKNIMDTTEKEWDQIQNTNVKGIFLLTKKILPSMIQNNFGIIINVSSGAGKQGFKNLSAYCASKFAVEGLTQSLSWEVADRNIRVMSICPGAVATKMQEEVDPYYFTLNKDKMLHPKKVAEKILEMILDPEDKYHNGISVDL